MITRQSLLRSKEYWVVKIQTQLFAQLEKYLSKEGMTRSAFAQKMGVSKGYVSQVLNGDFNHSVSKFVELSMAMGKVPVIHFEDIDTCIRKDELGVANYALNDAPRINTITIEVKYIPQAHFSFEQNKENNTTPLSISYNKLPSNKMAPA